MTTSGWLPFLLLLVVAGGAPAAAPCKTVEGAPAATSEPLVVGMREQIAKGDRAGLQKFLDTGQALILRGGHEVEVLVRHEDTGTVKVRRGARGLPLWTLERGVRCGAPEGAAAAGAG